MSAIRLSICIPTYNFGQFIGGTLSALVRQATDAVEIVVLDGGSTDETPAVVQDVARTFPRLAYHRTERPCGIDADLARTVDLARGEYCWLLSSDDVPREGALRRMLEEIASGGDVYLCNRTECDLQLRPLWVKPWLAPDIGDSTFRFTGPRDFVAYFDAARSIGALFSYLSSIVVRRERWNAAPAHDGLVGTHYAHVARLFSILQQGGSLRYVREPLVLCRGENDSFARGGVVRRFEIDVDGYLRQASALFPDVAVRRAFLAVMRREHPWWVFAEVRSRIDGVAAWRTLERKLLDFGYARWQLVAVGTLGATPPAMVLARAAWSGLQRAKKVIALRRRYDVR
jgi:O-antigen biosynthesis alpha-1,3-abequosyltransferase